MSLQLECLTSRVLPTELVKYTSNNCRNVVEHRAPRQTIIPIICACTILMASKLPHKLKSDCNLHLKLNHKLFHSENRLSLKKNKQVLHCYFQNETLLNGALFRAGNDHSHYGGR